MPCRILVVEDSPTQAEALSGLLREAGHRVSIATSGEEALEIIRSGTFDLVLSDVVMPVMDGFELCRRIKSGPEHFRVPVVLLTSLQDPRDIVRGLEVGADNYITKPYDPEQLLARVTRVVHTRRARRAPRATIGMSVSFLGSTFTINSDREQILDLLLSSIEDVISANRALEESQRQLTLDLAERRRAEEASRRAMEEAERANRAKSDFLSRMSHELRTPMNAILGFAQLMQYSELDEDDRESVDQILKAGRHLLAMINEVLDLSRIESGRVTLSLEPIAIADAVQQTANLLRMTALERGIAIEERLGEAGESFVLADLQRLKQVLLNLISNAIKYNREQGLITIAAEQRPGGFLRVTIQDTGFGIPPDRMERLFTPFERLGAEGTGVEGTGLGLALSKGFIRAMGGRIGAESVPEQGSTFWLELPLAARPASGDAPTSLSPLREAFDEDADPCTVLYIEDNLSNLRLVERIFAHRRHMKLLVAMQGGLGLDLARDHRPDLILLDLNLPDMSGTDVLQRLQQHPDLRNTPVIVISADATPQQTKHLLGRGARSFLTKPIDVDDLLRQVAELLAFREAKP